MYTTHGHEIPGSPTTDMAPRSRMRCGGPGLCVQCSKEAAMFNNAAEKLISVDEAKGLTVEPEFKKYKRKPFTIEAVMITEENIDELAKFIGTVKVKEEDQTKFIEVDRRLIPNLFRVYPGFYMTKLGDNVRCYSPRTFREQFELVE